MKHIIPMTLIAGMMASGAAFAQTGATTGAATTASPTTTAPMATPATGATPPSTSAHPAAVATSTNPRTTAAPVAGANSFTEGQARSRIEEKGFGNVADLKKDSHGVWRGTAMKDGKTTTVSLDYQGNVVSN